MNPNSLRNSALLSLFAFLLVGSASAAAQAGQLDSTFGSGGIASKSTTVTRTSNSYFVGAVAMQSDGKIVVAGGIPGNNDFTVPAVIRLNPDGSRDSSFGKNGVVVLAGAFGGYGALAIQSDGKILVTTNAQSSANGEIDRYTTTGHLDSSFGNKGSVVFELTGLSGVALQADGRILISLQPLANSMFEVTRLNTDGTTDMSFGTNGLALPPGGNGALTVLSNGEILVFGGLISRLTSSGAIDASFGVNGQLLASTAGQVVAGNGDILTAGTLVIEPAVPSSGLAAFAYQSVGIGDPAFGSNGGVLAAIPNFPRVSATGLGLESTGAIVELGTVSTATSGAFGLVRYTAQGQLDASFGSGGTVTTSFGTNTTPIASAITIQVDDKIIAAGTVTSPALHGEFNTSLVVARYLAK